MLTFEEFKTNYINVNIDVKLADELKLLHGIDAYKEVDSAVLKEYNDYVESLK